MPVYLPGLTLGGLGYGGASYGYSPYGSGAFPRLPVPTTGGYGGAPYGTSSYGSVDVTPPKLTGANPLDGFRVELFFSEEMRNDAALSLPGNYTFTDVYGVALTSVSVALGTPGSHGGYTSVIVTHSGSTLGGQYLVSAAALSDLAGNPILPTTVSFFAFGDVTTAQVSLPSPDDGRTLVANFFDSRAQPQPLLTEADFTPGVEDPASYEITTAYPVAPVVNTITQNPADLSEVEFDVHPMTSTTYDLVVGPSLAYDYDGSVLPSSDPNLNGVEVGTGTSVPTATDGLILSKVSPNIYGWVFEDTSGRVVPSTTYRVDFSLDVTAATISPPLLNATLLTLSVSDGLIQVNLNLSDVAGTKVIDIGSGAYTAQVPAAWSASAVTISLVRNQKAGFYSVLFDGVPLITFPIASATGAPTISAGASVSLGEPSLDVSLLKLGGVRFTSSLTIFTSAWNFIHGLSVPFTGSGLLARDRVRTKYGPLVRGWGDATPAQKQDVAIRLNGTEVEVAGVNPYTGEIYPAVPIPLTAPGNLDVEIDYIWFRNPAFYLSGLNTPGLALNVWDRAVGHTPGAPSPLPSGYAGKKADNRFPMGVALGPFERPSPKAIGHRYIGYQKNGYSALLNEPTTLLLNQNPHAVSIGSLTAEALTENGLFDGQTVPADQATPWSLDGVDDGEVVGDGTYRLVDDSSGSYGEGTAAVYSRDLDLSLPTAVYSSGRFQVEGWSANGVFTGVALGVHDGHNLLLIGALQVNGVRHLGVCVDASLPYLEESWVIGPSAAAGATSQSTLTLQASSLPPGVESGHRFRIASGPQAGVYQIDECGLNASDDGAQVDVTFSPALPEDAKEYGNDTFDILFEVDWGQQPVTVRAQTLFPDPGSRADVYVGGQISGLVASLQTLPAYPAQTALLLPATDKGVAFFGSVSRRATNSTLWDITQYQSVPERLTQTVQGITAFSEMQVAPEDDPNDPWYIVGGFGYAEVDATGNETLVKATSASDSIDVEYSYRRVEPFLTPKVSADIETRFRVESGYLGAGDTQVSLNNGSRSVAFKNLLYTQGPAGRRLVTDLPSASLSGLLNPVEEGWASTSAQNPVVRGQVLFFQKEGTDVGFWSKSLPDPVTVSYAGLVSEARVKVSDYTVGSVGIGFYFGASARQPGTGIHRQVYLGLGAGTVFLFDNTNTVLASFAFGWDDQGFHTYRLSIDPVADIVVLNVDDVVVGNAAYTAFAPGPAAVNAYLGQLGSGQATYQVRSTSCTPLRPTPLTGQVLGRTFGILLRSGVGAPDSIDSYRIPRTDSTGAPNSSVLAVPKVMDWRNYSHVRLYLDPTWGVSFYRPDWALPPWYTGDFVTETTDPTAAWATVEYALLPLGEEDRGHVQFGSPDQRAITQSRWDYMRYRLRGAIDGFGIAPQNMVLNRAFTFNSGEYNYDVTPEVKTIVSRGRYRVVVSDSAVYAKQVFVVQVDGTVLPSSDWSFQQDQSILLTSPLPGENYPVTVTFSPGPPITKEYLCTQPFEGSVTVLNEGTPPVPKSRDGASTTTVAAGSQINDPDDVLDDAESMVLNDPYRFIQFSDDGTSLYASTEFCEVEDGEEVHISIACDTPGPGHGLAEIALDGPFLYDRTTIEEGPAGPWGGQSPVIKGSAARFDQSSVLFASGGGFVDGVLGPGTAVLYPNGRGPDWAPLPPGTQMGMNQEFRILLVETTPREDLFDIASLLGDNVPPSEAAPDVDPNPDGVPGTFGNGAAAYQMEDLSSSPFSRLGPYSGLPTLSARSLLAGGAQLDGTEFVLQGGAQLPIVSTVTTGVLEAAN